MQFTFYKYQGTGNDFVIIDNRQDIFFKNDTKLIAHICDRKFGIGADGLILLENHSKLDFKMVYYNADGNQSSMCGNGGRCLVHFAKFLGIITSEATFEAIDGDHSASITEEGMVSLKMNDVHEINSDKDYIFLNTGSPHHVSLCDALDTFDVHAEGAKLRHNLYGEEGANINFVKPLKDNNFAVRTYERGVEAETLSCGTGVTAVALAMHHSDKTQAEEVVLHTPGGQLKVSFQKTDTGYSDIYLTGPAVQVFKGTWS
ncbi:MAG: diaminopimelate epimerase [Flavobacteriaceae bacterium]